MPNLAQRARKKLDIALLLKVCPHCLGDLVRGPDFSAEYYRCLQCNQRTEPRSEIGRLADLPAAIATRTVTAVTDFFPGSDTLEPELATG